MWSSCIASSQVDGVRRPAAVGHTRCGPIDHFLWDCVRYPILHSDLLRCDVSLPQCFAALPCKPAFRLQNWFQLFLNFAEQANCKDLACGSGSGVNLLFFACPFPRALLTMSLLQ